VVIPHDISDMASDSIYEKHPDRLVGAIFKGLISVLFLFSYIGLPAFKLGILAGIWFQINQKLICLFRVITEFTF